MAIIAAPCIHLLESMKLAQACKVCPTPRYVVKHVLIIALFHSRADELPHAIGLPMVA